MNIYTKKLYNLKDWINNNQSPNNNQKIYDQLDSLVNF